MFAPEQVSIQCGSRRIRAVAAIAVFFSGVLSAAQLEPPPRDPVPERERGNLAERNYELAISQDREAVRLDPANADAWLDMGNAYRALYHPGSDDPKDAEFANEGINALRTYLTLVPDSKNARQFFLEFCTEAERHDDAIAFFEAELKEKPDNPQLVRTIANLYAKKGDAENALAWFSKWTDAEPQNAEAWYTIGVACWEASYKNLSMPATDRRPLLERGIEALLTAITLQPDYFDARYM